MDLTDAEISWLHHVLEAESDGIYNFPNDYGEEETKVHFELVEKVHKLAKARRLWWAR